MPRRDPRLRLTLLVALVCGVAWGFGRADAKDAFLPPPPAPDFDFYVANVAAWIETECASCHRRGGGAYRPATATGAGAPSAPGPIGRSSRCIS